MKKIARPETRSLSRIHAALERRRAAITGEKKETRGRVTRKASPLAEGNPAVDVPLLKKDAQPATEILMAARVIGRVARKGKYLHVSDLLHKCMRKYALMERYEVERSPQPITINDAITYAQGEAIHDVLRDRMRSGAPEKVWGNWACRCGTTKTNSPSLFSEAGDTQCNACKGALTVYQEVPIFDDEYMIVGNPDIVLYLPEFDAFHVTELKSISAEQYKELVRPIPDHVIQVLFYWWLKRRAGYKVTNLVSIVYQTKGWLFKGPTWKEFTINALESESRLIPYLEEALAMKTAREGGELPKRVCLTAETTEARKCSQCQICFGDNLAAPKKIDIIKKLASSPRR